MNNITSIRNGSRRNEFRSGGAPRTTGNGFRTSLESGAPRGGFGRSIWGDRRNYGWPTMWASRGGNGSSNGNYTYPRLNGTTLDGGNQ